MFIREFNSKLSSRKEESVLFEALRKLRLLDDPQRMVAADPDDGGDAIVGWTVWGDAGTGGQNHSAAAVTV